MTKEDLDLVRDNLLDFIYQKLEGDYPTDPIDEGRNDILALIYEYFGVEFE